MGKDKEFKRYDSPFFGEYHAARVATDPTCVPSSEGKPMVRFKVVADSRNERFEPLWVEVNVGQFNANAASWLQKGDKVASMRGRIAQRLWGDDNENVTISLEFTELYLDGELIAELKDRGFDPQGEPNWTDDGDKKGKKKGKGGKDDKKKSGKPDPKKKQRAEIPPDDEDEDEGEDDDSEDEDVEIDEE